MNTSEITRTTKTGSTDAIHADRAENGASAELMPTSPLPASAPSLRDTMRVRGGLDPYAPIEKAPLYTDDRMRSRGFSVRLEEDGADEGWREVGLVSEDYLLVPNADVREMAYEIGARSGLRFEEARTFFDGRRYALALVAKSESVDVQGGTKTVTAVGDYVSLGLLFENSYDGSCRLSASLFAYRLACSNGMLASDLFARVRFRHSRESQGWEDELARSLAMLAGARSGLRRFARSASRLAGHGLGTAELATLRTGYLDRLPVTLWGKVVDRYLAHEAPTAWGLLNAGTHELWHTERMTRSDFGHNAYLTSNLIRYAYEQLESKEDSEGPASSREAA